MKKIIIYIMIIIIACVSFMIGKGVKNYSKETNTVKVKINVGRYIDENNNGEIVIYNDGTARYIPDFNERLSFKGEYTLEDNLFTIKGKKRFYEFVINGDALILNRYSNFDGTISDCYENKLTYTYNTDNDEIIIRANGGYYSNVGGGYLNFGTSGASYCSDMARNSSLYTTSGPYDLADNILILHGDNGTVKFEFEDGKFELLSSWVSGVYEEFADGEMVFEFMYDDEMGGSKVKISTAVEENEMEHYYNDNYTSEVIIYSNGVARYCPSVNSSVNFCGEYEITDNLLSIKEAETVHIFKLSDNQLVLMEYIDYQGKSHKYGDKLTFTKASEYKIDVIRPGVYYCENGRRIYLDNEGNICFYLYLDKEINVELDRTYDKIQGKYVIEGDKLFVEDEDNNKAEFSIVDDKLILKEYRLYDVVEENEDGIEAYKYSYGDINLY